jgi:phosphatidate cytidylyltransferase
MEWDWKTLGLVGGVLALLATATTIVRILKRRAADGGLNTAVLETLALRVRAWWLLCTVLAASFLIHPSAIIVLFGFISFWALREFITLTPTRPGDHRALFWVFFLCTPLQFLLVGMGYYEWYSIAIPVYAFLFIPARIALAGDYKRFLERTAKIQTGLLICVYCLSYAPALLTVPKLPVDAGPRTAASRAASAEAVQPAGGHGGASGPAAAPRPSDPAGGVRLLFFFIVMVQLSDALQYAWSQWPTKHVIVPSINATRTWEGLLGGTVSVTLLGAVLWWATPFQGAWWMSAAMSAVIALMGFAGGITMSAIKRDRGVKDFGTLVEGHGGVLDRIDSICFAAPVFFHCTRWWLTA